LDYAKVSSAHNFVKRNQKVFVKVMEIKDKKISLSIKDVD
jgi:predicted RNA-binding protein with RPS1 domain